MGASLAGKVSSTSVVVAKVSWRYPSMADGMRCWTVELPSIAAAIAGRPAQSYRWSPCAAGNFVDFQRSNRAISSWRTIMNGKHCVKMLMALLICAGVQGLALPTYATEQGEQRREARDTRQEGRSTARETKYDCRRDNEKSNAGCRQDKRSTKQDTRRTARDIKY